MDSFFLAEMFKYLYLLFSEKSQLPFDIDDYIFTTEAHLLPMSLSITQPPCQGNGTVRGPAPPHPWTVFFILLVYSPGPGILRAVFFYFAGCSPGPGTLRAVFFVLLVAALALGPSEQCLVCYVPGDSHPYRGGSVHPLLSQCSDPLPKQPFLRQNHPRQLQVPHWSGPAPTGVEHQVRDVDAWERIHSLMYTEQCVYTRGDTKCTNNDTIPSLDLQY